MYLTGSKTSVRRAGSLRLRVIFAPAQRSISRRCVGGVGGGDEGKSESHGNEGADGHGRGHDDRNRRGPGPALRKCRIRHAPFAQVDPAGVQDVSLTGVALMGLGPPVVSSLRFYITRTYVPASALGGAGLLCLLLAASARADEPYEHEPINYATAPVNDPVARLQARL